MGIFQSLEKVQFEKNSPFFSFIYTKVLIKKQFFTGFEIKNVLPLARHFLCKKNIFPVKSPFSISIFPYLNTIWRTNQTVAYYAALVIALPKRKLPRTLKTCILETIMIHQNQSDWNANNFSKSCCSRTSHLNSVKPGTKN